MKKIHLFLNLNILLISFHSIAESKTIEKLKLYNNFKGPGIAALKIKDGKVVHKEGFGFANIATKQKIDSKTNFNIASNSKQFTAYGIYLLHKNKKISVKDRVSKYIPEFPSYAKEVKVEDLLFHTSGLPDYMEICDSQKSLTNIDVLKLLNQKKILDFEPGSSFEYSNTGYVILSEIIERVSKKPFPVFIQEEIFNKLKMKNSHVLRSDGKNKIQNEASSYSQWPFFLKQEKVSCDTIYGDGGVVTNLDDYEKWLKFILSQEELFQPGKLKNGQSTNYAYGWILSQLEGKDLILHAGAWNAFKSFTVYVPQQKVWVTLFANYQAPLSEIAKEFALE